VSVSSGTNIKNISRNPVTRANEKNIHQIDFVTLVSFEAADDGLEASVDVGLHDDWDFGRAEIDRRFLESISWIFFITVGIFSAVIFSLRP
jgi:hypothetical protein